MKTKDIVEVDGAVVAALPNTMFRVELSDGKIILATLTGKMRGTLEQTTRTMMTELSKLNPQGHVHAQELYAAVNLVRRCPPGPILSILADRPWSNYLGDLYFRPASLTMEDAP